MSGYALWGIDMSNSTPVQQAYSDMLDTIAKHPNLKEQIDDAFDLMRDKIEEGKWEDLEIDRFYNRMVELTS